MGWQEDLETSRLGMRDSYPFEWVVKIKRDSASEYSKRSTTELINYTTNDTSNKQRFNFTNTQFACKSPTVLPI